MAEEPPPPYPGGPSAPLFEEKMRPPPVTATTQPQGYSFPPESGPPPYEAQPGFVSPHTPADGSMPMPPQGYFSPTHLPPGQFPPPGHFPTLGQFPPPGQFPSPGQYTPSATAYYPPHSGQRATVLVPPGAATTVTVVQGETFQATPVQTVCPHCQQPIITRITYQIGLLNTLVCLFCCFVGCDLGCCLIPCLIDDLTDVKHTCPYCKAYIYTYKRLC